MGEVIRAIQGRQAVGRRNEVQDTATIIITIMVRVIGQIRLNFKRNAVEEIVATINTTIVGMAQVLAAVLGTTVIDIQMAIMIDVMVAITIWILQGATAAWTVWIV